MRDEPQDLIQVRWQKWRQVWGFQGSPEEFWSSWTRSVADCIGGELAVLYACAIEKNGGDDWQVVSHWPLISPEKIPALVDSVTPNLLGEVRHHGVAHGKAALGNWRVGLLGVRVGGERDELVLVVHLGAAGLSEMETRQWLAIFLALPGLYELRRAMQLVERDALRLAHAVEFIGRVLASDHFDRAGLIIVNEFAERFACETVSLTWRIRGTLRLAAMSHSEKIDRRSELAGLLEDAGEEALAQRVEIVWPGEGKIVTIAHDCYGEMQRPGHMLTLPIFKGSESLGSVTLERQHMPFSGSEQWALRMLCDMLLGPVSMFEAQARPWLRRLVDETWRSVPYRWRPKSAVGRGTVLGLVVLVVLVLFLPLPYFVSATGIVKTDTMAFMGAPFDGYLESAPVTLGATIKAEDVVFILATRELTLEKASILADVAQYSREVEKRRFAGQMPDMQIAEAQVEQANARLNLVDYRLKNAEVRSPIDGVLVEGEPAKNLGGAVRRGDVVVKIAAVSRLYVEASIREVDLVQIAVGQSVRLTLLANPSSTYDMILARIIPASAVKEGENTFPARIEATAVVPKWWRPGMNCVTKIDVGLRPLYWIALHRIMDYFRLVFWF